MASCLNDWLIMKQQQKVSITVFTKLLLNCAWCKNTLEKLSTFIWSSTCALVCGDHDISLINRQVIMTNGGHGMQQSTTLQSA